jgi:hypothetical protein
MVQRNIVWSVPAEDDVPAIAAHAVVRFRKRTPAECARSHYMKILSSFQRRAAVVSLSACGLATLLPSAAQATVYTAVSGFSRTANPNGPWSFRAAGAILPKAASQEGDPSLRFWTNGQKTPAAALVGRNYSKTPYDGTTTVVPANYLDLDPETVANVGARFTAPIAGTYNFSGDFEGLDRNQAAHNVAVYYNGTLVWSTTIGGYGQHAPFSGRVVLKKGDTMDFVSETSGSDANLSTGLRVAIGSH